MEERVLPTPDKNIVCAAPDIPILDFYQEYYDSVYVMLHPFIKITAPDKIVFKSGNWPEKEQLNKYTEKLSWSEILDISGLETIKRLDVALRTSIGGLKKQLENQEDAEILQTVSEMHYLIEPAEGRFHELLIDDMMKALEYLGHDQVLIGDEFGEEKNLVSTHDVIENKVNPGPDRRNLYTHKNEILFTIHWDSFFTMLCSDRQTIEKILEKYPFEGFFCDKTTEIYWSVQ
jgi:hypothetical protein